MADENLPELSPEEGALQYKHAIKLRIEERMTQGFHLLDAARLAGVPASLVLVNIGTDDDFKRWWMESETRPRLSLATPEDRVPEKVKRNALNMLVDAGLFEKLAMAAAAIDPYDEMDRADLLKMTSLATKLMPSTSQSVQVKADLKDLSGKEEDEILAEIERVEQEAARVMEEKREAMRQREKPDGSIADEPRAD